MSRAHKRSVFLFGVYGAQPMNRDRVIQESTDAGLRAVIAKIASDNSENMLAKLYGESATVSRAQIQPYATEVLPDDASTITNDEAARLRRDYGEDWCVLPMSDYVTEYAAAVSTLFSDSCYPERSAEIVKRKHELRDLWNRLARNPAAGLHAVEYCYVELGSDDRFEYHPSDGFNALPEETPLIVKPDELSSSIEVHFAASKMEAVTFAHGICSNLQSKWHHVGQAIGTEVRPRVVMESAIQRSNAYHPGAEFSIEFISFDGEHSPIGITQKWTGPNFIETGQVFPAESFPEHLRPALENAIQQLLRDLRVRYAVSHWEFIITPDDQLALVEGHLRPAGDRIMELIEYSTGRSPVGALCEALAQGKANFSFVPRQACGVFWLVPETVLEQVTHVEIEHAVTDALSEDLYVNQRGILGTPNWSHATDWMARFVHVLVSGSNLEFITNCCRDVAASVILSGSSNGRPMSTPLKLAID
jgi:hypothetical protein